MNLTDFNFFEKQKETIVFAKTEVDISILFNYLKAGKTTEDFLDDYPQVSLEKVLNLIELAEEVVKANLSA